jgi:hypothetical protein
MDPLLVVLLLGPFIALVVMLGLVAVVALFQARTEDIPVIVKELVSGFRKVADHLPQLRRSVDTLDDGGDSFDRETSGTGVPTEQIQDG